MKAHLKDSDIPLIEGQDQAANCGQLVPKAAWVFIYGDADCNGAATMDRLRGVCTKCQIPWETRMRYGMLPGEEAIHES